MDVFVSRCRQLKNFIFLCDFNFFLFSMGRPLFHKDYIKVQHIFVELASAISPIYFQKVSNKDKPLLLLLVEETFTCLGGLVRAILKIPIGTNIKLISPFGIFNGRIMSTRILYFVGILSIHYWEYGFKAVYRVLGIF